MSSRLSPPNGVTESAQPKLGAAKGSAFTGASSAMDIARPDLARKKRRKQIIWITAAAVSLTVITVFLMRLEPAVPGVERSSLIFDSVKQGLLIRQVRGNGTLVPERIQYIQAETGGLVEKILILPGAAVEPETVLVELSNPDLKQAAFDSEWAAKAAEALLAKLTVQVESDRLAEESTLVTLRADAKQAELEARADEGLLKDGLVPQISQQKSRSHADDLTARVAIEEKRLKFMEQSAKSQLAVQEAEVEKLKAMRELKRSQVAGLRITAGISGVLTQIGDKELLQTGQRVMPGATLAKVVVPTQLKAEIKINETQARDVTLGQVVEVDTRNGVVGVVKGHVIRVDPAVINSTVTVDVKLDGALPKGARPDLSVEGTIEIDRLENVLNVGRPVQGLPDSTVGLFKVIEGGKYAVRVPVKLGRGSVTAIEVIEGLQVGDTIIMSDMNQWDSHNKVQLN
ncbi:MAG TPA: efflux RND transporter periplasmic adaptor subunit [Candidatus Limnocylindria bacterium]|jgi:multidrug resistance efflux pump|nr:efflux RND transporter periplasmic adaptor subunit [Candidatus Limnocylindria bacterium]